MQCFNCWKYGHTSKFCRSKERCGKCGTEGHRRDSCTLEDTCSNCKFCNERFNTEFDCKHSAREKCFNVYETELNNLRSKIDYGSSA